MHGFHSARRITPVFKTVSKILILLMTAVASIGSAHAASTLVPAPDGVGILDTATGLEWLPLTATAGVPYNQVVAGQAPSVPAGYQVATSDQVILLLEDAGMPASALANFPMSSGFNIDPAIAAEWISLFGATAQRGGPEPQSSQSAGDAVYTGSNPNNLLAFFRVTLSTTPNGQSASFDSSGPEPDDGCFTQPGCTQVNEGEFMVKVGAPSVSKVSPAGGPTTGGTTVTVTGSGFTGATTVTFGGTPGTTLNVTGDGQLTVVSPPGIGKVDVRVSTPSATSAPGKADIFAYLPTVTSIDPTFGPPSGGTTVTVRGTGFTNATGVLFGKVPGTLSAISDDTLLTAISPPGSGTVHVTVVTPGGNSPSVSADRFLYGVPTTLTLAASADPSVAGQTVTFTATVIPADGSAIEDDPSEVVTFTSDGNTLCSNVAMELGQATCEVNTLIPGKHKIEAMYPGDGNFAQSSSTISPTVLYATTITLSPNLSLSTSYGAKATVQATVRVTPGTPGSEGAPTPKGSVSFVATNTLAILGTAKLNGSGLATISLSKVNAGSYVVEGFYSGNQQQASSTSSALLVSINSVNTAVGVTSSSPTSAVGGSVTLTADVISATGVVPVGTVSFDAGTLHLGTVTVTKSGQAKLSTSALPVGANTIAVSYTPTSTNFLSSTGTITITTYPKPMVTGVSPATGTGGGGTVVTLTGTGFTGATGVTFDGVDATNLQVVSDTQLTVVTPAGSGKVNVAVQTPGGTSAGSASSKFAYQ